MVRDMVQCNLPTCATGIRELDLAFRIAVGDIASNIQPLPDGEALLEGIPRAGA